MKVAFIQAETESLGVEYLSAVLKEAGHTTGLYFEPRLFADSHVILGGVSRFFDLKELLVERIVRDAPDLLCFSVVTDNVRWALDVAEGIRKKQNIFTVFGGIHASSVPERLIRNAQVDAVCTGEGEEPVVELAERLERDRAYHDVAGLFVKHEGKIYSNPVRPLNQDLDTIPFPDKGLYYDPYPFYQNVYTIIASRGCPYNCSYCNNNVIRRLYRGKGKYLRRRSVSNVVEELKFAKETWNIRAVDFHDDIFTVDREWLRDLGSNYKKEIGLPFKCIAHVEYLDEDLLALLEDMGCRNMQVGVQTYNEKIRKQVLNRHMTNEQLEKALIPVQNTGIGLIADHILALPHDDEQSQVESARFYNRIKPKVIYGFWLTCYPKTEISQYCLEQGLISREDMEAMEEGNPKTIMTVGGKIKDRDRLLPFQFILGYIPLLPRRLVFFLLDKRRYRFLPGSPFFATVLPRLIKSFFWKDIRAKLNMNRYTFFIPRVLKFRLRKSKNASPPSW